MLWRAPAPVIFAAASLSDCQIEVSVEPIDTLVVYRPTLALEKKAQAPVAESRTLS